MQSPYQSIKVLHILPALDAGGVEHFVIDISQHLKPQVISYVASSGGKLVKILNNHKIKHFRMDLNSKNPLKIFLNGYKLSKLIRKENISVIHAHSRFPAWSSLIAAKIAKIPFVVTFHGTYNFNNSIKKYYNSIMVRGNKVIAISKFINNHIQNNYSKYIKKNSLELINEGIDLKIFNKKSVKKSDLQKAQEKLKTNKDYKVILMPARITNWKGQHIVLKAFKIAVNINKKISLFLVGSSKGKPAYKKKLEKYIIQNNLINNVYFIENIDNMPAGYLASDLIIHASIEPEAFGRTIIEAQAMEKPIIVSNLGSPKYHIQSGINGWFHNPGDYHDLSQRIIHVLGLSEQSLQKITKEARNQVEKYYDIKVMVNEHIALYKKITKNYE